MVQGLQSSFLIFSQGLLCWGRRFILPPFLLHIQPFQHYYRRARELRVGHSVKWNDGLLSDSLEASKLSVGLVLNKVMGVVPPAKKKTKLPVKQGLFRKGFLNLPPDSFSPSCFALGGQRCCGGRTFLPSEALHHSSFH